MDIGNILVDVQSVAASAPDFPVDHYRIYFIQSGRGAVGVDNVRMNVQAGDVIAASPTETVIADEKLRCLAVGFHHDFFCVRVQRHEVYCDGVIFNRVASIPKSRLPDQEWSQIGQFFEQLQNILDRGGVYVEDRAVSTLRSMLLLVAEYKLNSLTPAEKLPASPLSPLVLGFQDLLEENYVAHRDVAFYSEQLHVTPATLNRRLKSEIGLTVTQAVNERLAIRARVELRAGVKPVKQVAFELGFEDPLYFSRFFKKQFGQSPSHYFMQNGKASSVD